MRHPGTLALVLCEVQSTSRSREKDRSESKRVIRSRLTHEESTSGSSTEARIVSEHPPQGFSYARSREKLLTGSKSDGDELSLAELLGRSA